MKRVEDVAPLGTHNRHTGFAARTPRLPYGSETGPNEDVIDIVAVLAAIVFVTLIALAC